MHSKNCVFDCVFTYIGCVKNLTLHTSWLCFLQNTVKLKNFLTQLLSCFSAALKPNLTPLNNGLYTLNTGLITITKFKINFYYFC